MQREGLTSRNVPDTLTLSHLEEGVLYTPREVADIFKVDPKTVKRWISLGKLKAIRTPGGHYRISEASVTALKKES